MRASPIAFWFAIKMVEVGAFFAIGFYLENLIPAKSSKPSSRRLNSIYTVLFEAFEVSGTAWVVYLVTGAIQRAPFHNLIYLGNDRGRFWVAIALVLFAIFLGDFFYYWMHRLQHRNRWLWAEHELHHSEEEMNVTTAWRHHWLEKPIQALCITAPMAILFKPPMITVLSAYAIGQAFPYFIHLNAKINIGPLKKFFMNPHSHRIHHSKRPEHIDKNFASAFSIWDVIFGTYYAAAPDEWPETGLASGKTVRSLPDALTLPFRTWKRMLAEELGAGQRNVIPD